MIWTAPQHLFYARGAGKVQIGLSGGITPPEKRRQTPLSPRTVRPDMLLSPFEKTTFRSAFPCGDSWLSLKECIAFPAVILVASALFVTSKTQSVQGASPSPAVNPNSQPQSDHSFRLVIEVRQKGNDRLFDQHLVLFDQGKIYDFELADPHDVMIIDPEAGNVTLVSLKNQIKASKQVRDIVTIVAKARVESERLGRAEKFGITAKAKRAGSRFSIEYGNEQTRFRYDVDTRTPESEIHAIRFAEFSDWACRVNLVRGLGAPPFARMNLAKALADASVIPTEQTREFTSPEGKLAMVSTFRFSPQLVDADKKRIDELHKQLALFRNGSFERFPKD